MRERTRSLFLLLLLSGSVAGVTSGCIQDSSKSPSVPGSCKPVGHAIQDLVAEPMVLRRQIPAAVSDLYDKGRIAGDTAMPVTIVLGLNHEAELDQLVAQVNQPGSPNFHKFITPQEFKARFAPTPEQISRARSYLESHGLRTSDANGFLLHATGTAGAVSEAFQTEIHQYEDVSGKNYFAPSNEPLMPEGLKIRAAVGLQDLTVFRPHLIKLLARTASSASASARAQMLSGSGPNGGLAPQDIRSLYSMPNLSGSGQALALVELDGYNGSDISSYERAFGVPGVPIRNILVDGATGSAGSSSDEVTMDIELMLGIAPGASQILVYEAPDNPQAILDLYQRIANDDQASVVSSSWGAPENSMGTVFAETENVIFKQMVVQGQAMFASAGDYGAYDNGTSPSVDDPASQPFVTGVGGTTLTSVHGVYEGETTWNGGSVGNGAGGGGISATWTQPSWQKGLANSANGASGSMRNVPDVSLNADPRTGYAIYFQGAWQIFGGTSAATPIWASFIALVNEQRQRNGLSALGFVNPYLYSVANASRYTTDFHDIQDGSTNLIFPAVEGYDDATGLGTPQCQNLFDDLIQENWSSSSQAGC